MVFCFVFVIFRSAPGADVVDIGFVEPLVDDPEVCCRGTTDDFFGSTLVDDIDVCCRGTIDDFFGSTLVDDIDGDTALRQVPFGQRGHVDLTGLLQFGHLAQLAPIFCITFEEASDASIAKFTGCEDFLASGLSGIKVF